MEKYIIYLATNLINGKQYVGQTKDWRLEKRIQEHLYDAADKTKNVAFHNALNKYGIENFKVETVETDISEENIDEREIYWITYYNTYIHAKNSNGYNETLGGQGIHGYIFTELDREKISIKQKAYWQNLKETNINEYNRLCEIRRQNKLKYKWTDKSRKKLSESCKGRPARNKNKKMSAELCKIASEAQRSKAPNISCYSLETGLLIQVFNSCIDAAEYLGLAGKLRTIAGRIHTVCATKRGHAYGYIWRFEHEYLNITKLTENELIIEHTNPRAKAIKQFDMKGNFVAEFESAAAYSKTVTDSYKKQRYIARAINTVCLGKAKTYLGFIWKYKE